MTRTACLYAHLALGKTWNRNVRFLRFFLPDRLPGYQLLDRVFSETRWRLVLMSRPLVVKQRTTVVVVPFLYGCLRGLRRRDVPAVAGRSSGPNWTEVLRPEVRRTVIRRHSQRSDTCLDSRRLFSCRCESTQTCLLSFVCFYLVFPCISAIR